jgi:type I restriction enzyme S subunit
MAVNQVELAELVKAHYGKALKKENRDESGGYEVYGSSGQVGFHSDVLCDFPTLIIGRKGSVGEVSWAPRGGWIIDTAYYLEILDSSKLDLRYLFYALRKADLAKKTITTSIPGLNRDDFYETKIPLPPLPEQKRIATILDKADNLRRKNQQAIQLAEKFLRSVFLDMFGDLFGDIGYQFARKKPISELTTYIDYRGKTPEKSESGVPLITAKNVKKGFISEEPREFIPESNYESWMTRGQPLENDVLFTTEAPLGNAALLRQYQKVAVGQRLVSLRSKGELTQEYLLFCLLNPYIQNLIEQKSSGSTAKGIRTKELYQIELPIPDIVRQNKFSSVYKKTIAINQNYGVSEYCSSSLFNTPESVFHSV